MRRVVIAEDAILYLMLSSVLLVFTTELNSHFTLPKLFLFVVLTALLQLPMLVRVRLGAVNMVPGYIWFGIMGVVLWWLIATSHAVNTSLSLYGQYGRYNGLYTHLTLLCLFITLIKIPFDEKRIKRLIVFFALIMCVVAVYALVQYAGLDPVFSKKATKRPISTIGNAVTLAAVILVLLPLLIFLVSYAKTALTKSLGISVVVAMLGIMVITGSRGPWLATLVALVTSGVYLLWRYRGSYKVFNVKYAYLMLAFFFIAGLVMIYGPVSDRLSLGFGFLVRLFYFDVALQMIADSPFFGYGFESFRLMYPEYRPENDIVYYKDVTPTMVHNDYLQLAVDSGIPALGFYLFLMIAIIFLFYKKIVTNPKESGLPAVGLVTLLGYLAYGMSGWPEISSLVMFWLILGVLAGHSLVNVRTDAYSGSPAISTRTLAIVLHALFFIACVSYGYMTSNKVLADSWLRKAQFYVYVSFPTTENYLKKIANLAYEDSYYIDQLGLLYMRRLAKDNDPNYYVKARFLFSRSVKMNPRNTYAHIHLIENDIIALKAGMLKRFSREGEQALEQIQSLDPNNYSIYKVRARAYLLVGDKRRAAIESEKMKRFLDLRKTERPKLLGAKG